MYLRFTYVKCFVFIDLFMTCNAEFIKIEFILGKSYMLLCVTILDPEEV